MAISLYDRVENTVGKGENGGYQHFLLFSQCFPNFRVIKSPDCVLKSKAYLKGTGYPFGQIIRGFPGCNREIPRSPQHHRKLEPAT